MKDVVILSAMRTPMAAFQGAFAGLSAPQLGAAAIRAAVAGAGVSPERVDEVHMGCVLPAGLGQAPARQAALGGGLPLGAPCTTISKVCGSGMKAVMIAHDLIKAGNGAIQVAGGMESMTNAPYFIPKGRAGLRMGHGSIIDHMFFDGLEDAYEKGRLMGSFAEDCAGAYGFTRAAQDAYAVESLTRARRAMEQGAFTAEIAPVSAPGRKGETVVAQDEQPFAADISKIPALKPAFRKDGTVTAGSSSSISDGGAALVLAAAGTPGTGAPIARIVGHASHAQQPALFTTAPVFAIRKLLDRLGWRAGEVDLWEINEAFAVVTMAAIHDLGLDAARVNIHGGACALGHPIGASGARLIVTLLHALARTGGRRGIASLCIGGGEATAIAVESL